MIKFVVGGGLEGAQLMRVHRPWPWGLVVIGDPVAGVFPRDAGEGNGSVWATRSMLVLRVMHEVDGPVGVQVRVRGEASHAAETPFHGALLIESGSIEIADATGDRSVRADIASGEYFVEVHVDDSTFPSEVLVLFSPAPEQGDGASE